jgi:hypothetical protein
MRVEVREKMRPTHTQSNWDLGWVIRDEKEKVTVYIPYNPQEITREKAEESLREELEGFVYACKTIITSPQCTDHYSMCKIIEAEEIKVIDLTHQRGSEIHVEKHYYVKPPAKVEIKTIHVEQIKIDEKENTERKKTD